MSPVRAHSRSRRGAQPRSACGSAPNPPARFSSLCASAPSCCRNATSCPDRLIFSHPWCELVRIFKRFPCIGVPDTCNAFCAQESWAGLFLHIFEPFRFVFFCFEIPLVQPVSFWSLVRAFFPRRGWNGSQAGFHPRYLAVPLQPGAARGTLQGCDMSHLIAEAVPFTL